MRGFTLIELLIAISIIAIIAAVGASFFNQAQMRGRDAKRKQDLKQIALALEVYRQRNGIFPMSTPLPTGCTSDVFAVYCFSNNSTSPWLPVLDSSYLQTFPKDPKANMGEPNNGTNFGYAYRGYLSCNGATNTDGIYYILYTRLENPNDPDRLAVNDRALCPQYGSLLGVGFVGSLYVITN